MAYLISLSQGGVIKVQKAENDINNDYQKPSIMETLNPKFIS